MVLPVAPNSISFSQIKYEFGPRTGPINIGSYFVNENIGSLTNLPLDVGIPTTTQEIKFSDFYNKRLNVIVDYFSGVTTSFRNTARADFDSQNIVVVGGLLDPGAATTTSSGRRVIVNVNKTIGSQKSSTNPYICALRTGNGWEPDTDLGVEIGPSGQIVGAGGDGGDAGFTLTGRDPVLFVDSFGGASVSSIGFGTALQGGDLVILVSAASTTTTVGGGVTSVGDRPVPSGFQEIDAYKIPSVGIATLPFFKVSYKVMPATPDTQITGLLSTNSIHVASVFRGFQDFSGNVATGFSTTGTTVTFPTITTDEQSLVFLYGIVKDDNIAPVTASGYIGIRSVDFGTGNNVNPGCTLVLGYRNASTSGPISPGSFTSGSWDGDGWVAGSVPLGGIASGTSNVNGKTGTSGLGIQYPCTINNAGLILSGRGGGGAGGRGRGSTSARTQDGCEGFGRYVYGAGGGGGGGRGLPGGSGGSRDTYIEVSLDGTYGAQNGFDGNITSGGGGGAGGYSGTGRCVDEADGGSGGGAGSSGGAGSPENVSPIGGAGGNGAAIVVNSGVPVPSPTGNAPNGSVVSGVTVS